MKIKRFKKYRTFLLIILLACFVFLFFDISTVSALYLCTFNPPGGFNPPPSCYRDTTFWCANFPGCAHSGSKLQACGYQLLNMIGPGVYEPVDLDPNTWKPTEEAIAAGLGVEWCNDTYEQRDKTIRPIIDVGNPGADCNVAGVQACIFVHCTQTQDGAITCGTGATDPHAYLDIGEPPDIPTNLSRVFDPCASWNNYLVNLSWTYEHPAGTPMQAYQISIYPAAEFSGGPYEVPYAANDGDTVTFQPPTEVMWRSWLDGSSDGIIKWGDFVDWRVRVQDNLGLWSEWSSWASASVPPAGFTFPFNSYPWVNFVWDPPGESTAGTDISFDSFDPTAFVFPDLPSEVFGGAYTLDWIFPAAITCVDPDPCDWSDEDPIIQFNIAGIQDVTLTITDLIGPDPNTGQVMTCNKTKSIAATFPLPKYREVAPVL